MAEGHPRALAAAAEASVAVAEIRDATRKLILNSFEFARQVSSHSPTTSTVLVRHLSICII